MAFKCFAPYLISDHAIVVFMVQDPIPPTLHTCFLTTTTTSGRGSAVVAPTPFETERATNVQSVLTVPVRVVSNALYNAKSRQVRIG